MFCAHQIVLVCASEPADREKDCTERLDPHWNKKIFLLNEGAFGRNFSCVFFQFYFKRRAKLTALMEGCPVCACVFFLLFLRVSFAYGYVDQTIVVDGEGAYLFERALLLCVQVNVAHCICLGFVILAGRGEDSTRR